MGQRTPNPELVVYVLSLLGGESKSVHTEDIALKCHELFSDSFSWTKYPEYPDKEVVRVGLMDARREKNGQLVKGRAGQDRGKIPDGWMLTEDGIEWLKKNHIKFEAWKGSKELKEHRQKILRRLKRVKQHGLYEKFLANREQFSPSIGDLADLLRCRVDANPAVWEERLESVLRKAQAADQKEIMEFIEKCNQAYLDQR